MKPAPLLLAVFVGACTSSGPTPLPSGPAAARWAGVPTWRTPAANCEAPPITPTLCDWVTAHDVVATARILSAEVSWDPAAKSVGGVEEPVDPETCLSLDPAVHLRVAIVDVHSGSLDDDEVDVFIGAKPTTQWAQRLTSLFPTPAFRWSDNADRFEVGKDIVLTGFDVGSGVSIWTALPSVDQNDVLTFPPAPCNQPGFIGTGMSTASFFAAAAACPAPTEASRALRAAWDVGNAPQQGRLTTWRDAKCYVAGGS